MKTIVSVLLMFAFLYSGASDNQYQNAMGKALKKLNRASENVAFLEAANDFERISQHETKEWLPLYYLAQCYVIVSFKESDLAQKDVLLDKAQAALDKAFRLKPKESELFALQAFLYPARILVDPMGRGMEYAGKMNRAIDEAIALNPDNPRPYYLRAISTLNMPENYGGGPAVAKSMFEEAQQKFERFQPATPLSPNWGKVQNEAELAKMEPAREE